MIVPQTLENLGFGLRSLTFQDFEIACRECDFKFFFTDEKLEEGLTFPYERNGKKERVIILRKTLFRESLEEVCWHEFDHAYFDHYGVRLFVEGSEDKYEREADDFSFCCRIPTIWIRTKNREELLAEGFTDEQINRRKEIYDSRGV